MTLSDLAALRAPRERTARVWQALDLLQSDSGSSAFVRKSWSDAPKQAFASQVIKTWSLPGQEGDLDAQALDGLSDEDLLADSALSADAAAAATLALTEEALETERQGAYDKGLEEGRRQVREEWNTEKNKTRLTSESIMVELDAAVRRVIDTPDKLYEPIKRLALHLAEQLVLAELTVSSQAIERLVRRCVDELAPQRLAPITVELNAADLAVLQAMPVTSPAANNVSAGNASDNNTSTKPEGAPAKPTAPQWPWHLQASDDLLPGSVRASASDAVVSDLIEHRLEVLARGLLLDSTRGMAQSAFQPSRMAARMSGEREVVDAQPRMSPAPAPTRSFAAPMPQDLQDIDDKADEPSDGLAQSAVDSQAPVTFDEIDLSAMDLPNINLDGLDAQADWKNPAPDAELDAGQFDDLNPETDKRDV
jgi:flagellar biosynthesis/type III secretory pathway protein FliH